jgi:16S rRNA U516 pseudouridylate synthase RsuA-like enzyme
MFDFVGHSVLKLKRVRIGFLRDDNLKPGAWRLLADSEVRRLMKPTTMKKPSSSAKKRGQR